MKFRDMNKPLIETIRKGDVLKSRGEFGLVKKVHDITSGISFVDVITPHGSDRWRETEIESHVYISPKKTKHKSGVYIRDYLMETL